MGAVSVSCAALPRSRLDTWLQASEASLSHFMQFLVGVELASSQGCIWSRKSARPGRIRQCVLCEQFLEDHCKTAHFPIFGLQSSGNRAMHCEHDSSDRGRMTRPQGARQDRSGSIRRVGERVQRVAREHRGHVPMLGKPPCGAIACGRKRVCVCVCVGQSPSLSVFVFF